jgi:hypothetical protein
VQASARRRLADYNPAGPWGERVNACKECGISEDEGILSKCPICHQMICEDHKFVRSGRIFCSEYCGAAFFHGDDEDGLGEDD